MAWNYLEWGGAQIYFLGIARQLKERADFVMVAPLGTSSQFLTLCEREGIPVEFVDLAVPATLPATYIGKLRRHILKIKSEIEFVKRLTRDRYDLVHVDLSPWQSLTALLALATRMPVFYTVHNRLPRVSWTRRLSWRLKFLAASLSSRLRGFASNEDARKGMGVYAPAAYVEDVAVTFTNVNRAELDSISRSPEAKAVYLDRFSVRGDETVVTSLGQFIDRKGRWILLEAASKVAREHENVRLFWVTDTDLDQDEIKRIEKYALGERFRILKMDSDFADRADMLGFIASSDIFVLPSFVEGLPIALMEAMYLGVPSISTSVNGIPEAVRDKETGLLVAPGSSEELSSAILRLAGDKELSKRLAEAGRQRVGESFVEDQVAEVVWTEYARGLRRTKDLKTGTSDE